MQNSFAKKKKEQEKFKVKFNYIDNAYKNSVKIWVDISFTINNNSIRMKQINLSRM